MPDNPTDGSISAKIAVEHGQADAGYEYDVFLSYPHAPPFGRWVHEHLLQFFEPYLTNALSRPARVFVDRTGIIVGDSWPERLKRALARSRCMVAIWSPSYFGSAVCVWECVVMLHRAFRTGYTPENPGGLVLPAKVHDGEHFPKFVKDIHYTDFSRFARVGEGFTKTERYIEFQDLLITWTDAISKVVATAPTWNPDWMGQDWVEEACKKWLGGRVPDPVDGRFSPPFME